MTTTARLLLHLDAIRHELTAMENTIRDAPPNIRDADRRLLRERLAAITAPVDDLLAWLGESRLEVFVS